MSTADRMAAVVTWWVARYTRRLPAEAAERRQAELASDLWEQRTYGRMVGASTAAVALSVLRRMVAGMPADLRWRHHQLAATRGRPLDVGGRPVLRTLARNWWLILAALTGLFEVVSGVGMPFDRGRQSWKHRWRRRHRRRRPARPRRDHRAVARVAGRRRQNDRGRGAADTAVDVDDPAAAGWTDRDHGGRRRRRRGAQPGRAAAAPHRLSVPAPPGGGRHPSRGVETPPPPGGDLTPSSSANRTQVPVRKSPLRRCAADR